MRRTILILAMFFAAAGAARADYAVLRSGQRLHITGYERVGDTVRLTVEGGVVEVPATELIAIEPEEVFKAPAAPPPTGPYGDIIRAAAKKHGLDEALVSSIIAAESNFNPRAVSRKQAFGLMQVQSKTGAQFSVSNLFDPAQNVDAGTRYFKQLLDFYHGDLAFALAAYNAGPERVALYGGVPPFSETRHYIQRVTADLAQRKKDTGSLADRCIALAFACTDNAATSAPR